jgi:hypothetical protein
MRDEKNAVDDQKAENLPVPRNKPEDFPNPLFDMGLLSSW